MKIDITTIENDEGEVELPTEPVVEETESEEAGTVHPVITYVKENPAIVGTLAVVLVLLVLLIISSIRNKKNSKEKDGVLEERKEEALTVTAQPQEEEKGKMVSPIKSAAVHEQGAREDQQDSFDISDYINHEKGMLAVVADGMGGLSNGKEISSLAVNTCFDVFRSLPDYISHADLLLQMAVQSNKAVNQRLRAGGQSGSTLVAAVIGKGKLHYLTIGDSRIYLYRAGALLQLNREHVYREELALRAVNGSMSIHQTNNDPQAKSLTSYLGIGQIPYLDRNYEGIKLISGDKILLASDGVFGTLSGEQMETALSLPAEDAAVKMCEMVREANRPYQDNYTAVVLEYHG